jgi:hypothetical protein
MVGACQVSSRICAASRALASIIHDPVPGKSGESVRSGGYAHR